MDGADADSSHAILGFGHRNPQTPTSTMPSLSRLCFLRVDQGRYRHYTQAPPSLLAKLLCRLFHPTSSVATAGGMQALLDVSGSLRVVVAAFVAFLGRLITLRGLFYRLAGHQARLLDDLTGTAPPYDRFVCLGPDPVAR